ncbi:hypothetical protein [Burkholderia sp. HI2500]|uniref:hypothetical protein n=1 Tax=Burkholderia sp. HI2500 TaxID=2015358 RepID=UPI00211AE3D9|nr:hypothetical protein [Burkholderia sp. HI2500]
MLRSPETARSNASTSRNRKAGHIRVKRAMQRRKMRRKVIEQFEITPALAARPIGWRRFGTKECLSVFTPKCGTHYTRDGFKGCRGKLMSETIEVEVIAGRFAFHDLRAYYAPNIRARRPARPACEPGDNRTGVRPKQNRKAL